MTVTKQLVTCNRKRVPPEQGELSCLCYKYRCVCLHRDLYHMLAGGVGDDGALDGLSVDDDLLDTLLLSVGVDGYLVLGIAELAADGVVAGCLGQTGV